jgi:hypothetical protein
MVRAECLAVAERLCVADEPGDLVSEPGDPALVLASVVAPVRVKSVRCPSEPDDGNWFHDGLLTSGESVGSVEIATLPAVCPTLPIDECKRPTLPGGEVEGATLPPGECAGVR